MFNGLNSLIPPKDNKADNNLPIGQPAQPVQKEPEVKAAAFSGANPISQNIPEVPKDIAKDIPQPVVSQNNFPASEKPADIKAVAEKTEEEDLNKPHQKYHRRPEMSDAIFQIEVEKIKPNPFQPRKNFDEQALKDLANSIREHGILQPLVVSKIESDVETGTSVEYQLIAGERRLRAAKIAGLERVPVIIRKVDQKSHQLEIAIIENLQRENLDSVETARSYARLQDEFGMTQREIAVRLGKSRELVANTLRLLSLPTQLQNALSKGQINESQARLLLSVENPTAQSHLFDEIISNNLTVREVRNRVKKIHLGYTNVGAASGAGFSAQDAEFKNLEDKFKEVLGTEVKIEKKGDSGKIVINFYSPEEIYGFLHKIDPNSID